MISPEQRWQRRLVVRRQRDRRDAYEDKTLLRSFKVENDVAKKSLFRLGFDFTSNHVRTKRWFRNQRVKW